MSFSGGVVGIKLLTSTLGPEGYGELALGMTIAIVLQQIFYGPFGQVAFRYYSIYRQKNQLNIFFDALKRIGLWSIAIFVSVSLIVGYFAKITISNKWFYLIIFASLFGILDGINGILIAIQNAARQRKVVAFFQGLTQWARPLAGVTAVILFSRNGQTALAGFCVAMVFITAYQGRFLGKIGFKSKTDSGRSYKDNIYKNFLNYGYPFLIWGIFGAVQFSSDRWILKYFFSEREVGIYSAMYQIASVPVLIIGGVLSQFVTPILFEKSNSVNKKTIYRLIKQLNFFLIIIMGFLLIGYYFFSLEILTYITSNEFITYHMYLPLILISLTLFLIAQNLTILGSSLLNVKVYIFPKIVLSLNTLLLGFLFTYFLGFKGIIISSLIANIIYFLHVMYTNQFFSESHKV